MVVDGEAPATANGGRDSARRGEAVSLIVEVRGVPERRRGADGGVPDGGERQARFDDVVVLRDRER